MQHVNAVDQKDDVIVRYSKFREENIMTGCCYSLSNLAENCVFVIKKDFIFIYLAIKNILSLQQFSAKHFWNI